ncbi:hypothetical protein PAXRUDRAFT_168035, partial [Paxillus rubicundulus Ve08.2h10]
FLFHQQNPSDPRDQDDVPLIACLLYDRWISVFNSASATFYAPSDISGIGSMRHEFICSCPIWRNENPHYNCAFVSTSSELKGMRGMEVVCVLAFFSFVFQGELYPCAVVRCLITLVMNQTKILACRLSTPSARPTSLLSIPTQYTRQPTLFLSTVHSIFL